MGINTQTTQFKNDLVALINGSNLPAINVLFVLNDAIAEVQKIYNQALIEESEGLTNGNSDEAR